MTFPITSFIIQRLLEFDPKYDVGSGVPTTGLLIDPLAIILQPIVDELTMVQQTASILTVLEAADPDAFPEDIVDAIASNFLVQRQPGDIGDTVERIRFFEPTDFSSSQGVLIFRGPSGQRYANSEAVSIAKSSMALNREGSLYYVDIPIIAVQEGSVFNTDAGTITSMDAEPAGVANMTNLYKVSIGRDRETNLELIARIKVAVTVRALVTGRGIVVTLTENFTSILEVQPIGFGDDEMMRDIVYNVHIGGDVDVFVKTPLLTDSYKDVFNLKLDTTRRVPFAGSVIASVPGTPYSIGRASIDRTNLVPVVKSMDGLVLFVEGSDYTLDDLAGTIVRSYYGLIFHENNTNGTIASAKRITVPSTGEFANVRAGMVLTITSPSTLVGKYTIKAQISSNELEIIGSFPVIATPVTWEVDDLLSITFEYNPVSVDICAAARDASRTAYTITEVPVIRVESVEELDPITEQPTGTLLNSLGGFGRGPFGSGPFGRGSAADYWKVVPSSLYRFSSKEDIFLEFDQSLIGISVRISYKWDDAIAMFQAFVDDPQNRTEAASLLMRHFLPVFVDSQEDINYDVRTQDQANALTTDEMAAKIVSYVDDVDQAQPVEISDIVDLMYNNGAVEVDLDSLMKLRGELHHQDGAMEYLVPDSRGVLAIPNNAIPDPTSRPLSPRIARFIGNTINLVRNFI